MTANNKKLLFLAISLYGTIFFLSYRSFRISQLLVADDEILRQYGWLGRGKPWLGGFCSSVSNVADPINSAQEDKLSVFIITMFYAFAEQFIDEKRLKYRFKALQQITSENVKLIKDNIPETIEWVIITQPAYKRMFNWSDLATQAIVETNPFPKRRKFLYDEYELDRGGKYPFLRNRLPHLTINLDSNDCMSLQYVQQLMEYVRSRNTTGDELHLFYTGSVYSYDPCRRRVDTFHDRFSHDGNGAENYSMGLALLNNSTNNILNVAMYGHGGPPEKFPHMGYSYGVTPINIPGLYVQTPFSHSRGSHLTDQALETRECAYSRDAKYNGVYWN